MKKIALALFGVSLLGTLGQQPAQANAVFGGIYAETGDAGDHFNPQDIYGGTFSEISGTIGDGDNEDAFRFYFGGGGLSVEALLDGHASALNLLLFGGGVCAPVEPCLPIAAGLGGISQTLSAGNYILEAYLFGSIDPPFTFTLTDPATNQPVEIGAPIPTPVSEPAALALLATGMAACASARRARHSKIIGS